MAKQKQEGVFGRTQRSRPCSGRIEKHEGGSGGTNNCQPGEDWSRDQNDLKLCMEDVFGRMSERRACSSETNDCEEEDAKLNTNPLCVKLNNGEGTKIYVKFDDGDYGKNVKENKMSRKKTHSMTD